MFEAQSQVYETSIVEKYMHRVCPYKKKEIRTPFYCNYMGNISNFIENDENCIR